ncbi:hypothetical protein [Nesterenkonia massiliensis]|uniref:hypothetical protein n=1 Tax=Nesterenkonia massiliensis TaxID=1232429 RepID=UPI0005CB01FA|nr:hypothetical protein [Nesterenkonia massiliensis]
MKLLPIAQIIFFTISALALLGVALAVFAEHWRFAAGAATVSAVFFMGLVALTLAFLQRQLRIIRARVRTIDQELMQNRHIAAGVRRIDDRTADRFKMMEATEARLEAAERRLLATFEAHRFQLEDELAELKEARSPQQ